MERYLTGVIIIKEITIREDRRSKYKVTIRRITIKKDRKSEYKSSRDAEIESITRSQKIYRDQNCNILWINSSMQLARIVYCYALSSHLQGLQLFFIFIFKVYLHSSLYFFSSTSTCTSQFLHYFTLPIYTSFHFGLHIFVLPYL